MEWIPNMRVWFICIVLLFTMLGVLSVVDTVFIPFISKPLVWAVLCVSTFCWLLSHFLKRFHLLHLSNNASNHSVGFIYRCVWGFHKLLFLIFVLGIYVAAVLQVVITQQQAVTQQLSTSIRVVATVNIVGISDSFFNQETKTGYRQLAVIHQAKPLVSNINYHTADAQQALSYLTGKRVLLSSFSNNNKLDLNSLKPNQQVRITLQLDPLPSHDTVKSGFNAYRWLRTRHIDAQAKVLDVHSITTPQDNSNKQVNGLGVNYFWSHFKNYLDTQRFIYRQYFLKGWHTKTSEQQQADAVTLSLLTGDRALISKSSKDMYQFAGMSHLLAISGTHVLFLAIMVSMFGVGLINKTLPIIYLYIPRWLIRWLLMIFIAALYALFTGFDVPAARTLWMLIAVGLMRFFLVKTSPQQILLMVAVVMAWADPYVLWQAGFWLSFMAVMLLISFEQVGNPASSMASGMVALVNENRLAKFSQRFIYNIKRLIKLQVWIFVSLLPLSLLLFGKVSWWGLPINMVAIGLYGWLLVPANLLAGILYPVLPSIANGLWEVLSLILLNIHELLTWLSNMKGINQQAWIYNQLPAGMLLVFMLVALPWLLPKHVLSRLFAIPPLFFAVMMIYNQGQDKQTVLTVITHKDPYLTSQLIQTKDDSWLIVTDFMPADSYYKRHITVDMLTQFWQEQLGKNGVNKLTGLIMQTPNSLLTNSAKQLSSTVPVGQFWQAGFSDDIGYINNELDVNADSRLFKPCLAGHKWQSKRGDLAINAITGWDVNAKTPNETQALKNCVIEINSIQTITIKSKQPAVWSVNGINSDNKQTVNDIDKQANEKQILPLVNRIIIDAASNNKTWQMWELMCKNNGFSHQYPINSNLKTDKNLPTTLTMMVSHASSKLTQQQINNQQAGYLLLNNPVNKYNQAATQQKLLQHQQSSVRLR